MDDQPLNVAVLEELLDDYIVETATCGQEALDKLESCTPDVILLDVMMPGLSGYEVCERIKSSRRFDETIVIFLSAKAMEKDIMAGYDAGADDFITKPFDHDQLLAKMAEICGSSPVDR